MREQYEEEFEAFKTGVLIQEARKQKQMTQEKLAKIVGTKSITFQALKTMQVIYVVAL